MSETVGIPQRPNVSIALTIRVSYIPRALTSDQFLKLFKDFVERNTPKEKRGKNNILLWSYAPSPISADSGDECVATVTFLEIPSVLHHRRMEIELEGVEQTFPVVVDSHFIGLTPLNNPTGEITVDIVAVTGLAGHAFGSWKSRNAPTMWLRDFLPKSLPTARILTYGYDSALLGSESNASIREFAGGFLEALKTARAREEEQRRPIIFIGHSLGGLVIKQALVRAGRGSAKDQQIFNSCYGMLFFGVPNRGLDVQAIRSMVKGQPNSRLVADLDPSSQSLRLLHEAFCDQFTFEESSITSVYETKLTRTVVESAEKGLWERTGPMVLMVPETSATYSGPTEKRYDQLSIDSDHSNIVKFSDRSNTDFLAVRQRILGFVEEAPAVIEKRFAALGQAPPNLPAKVSSSTVHPSPTGAATAPVPQNEEPPETQQASVVQPTAAKKAIQREEHPDLTALAGRALMYQNQGRLSDAQALWVQVVISRRRVLGGDHPNTLAAMAQLAVTYVKLGRLDEGQALWVQVVATNKRIHGENHSDTLTAMARLASTYTKQGRLKEARALWIHVVAAMGSVFGEDHPNTQSAKTRLAATYQSQGRR